ncbi:MAG: tRNA guanosine(15) transglycosylase TgtA [Candidatus Altiarchaeota archaeon]
MKPKIKIEWVTKKSSAYIGVKAKYYPQMTDLLFELKDKDIAGRIGTLTVNGKTLTTPALMPVVNPNNPLIPVKELLKEFGSNVLMTNAYIFLKSDELREKALRDGVHSVLGAKDAVIATDSGSYQLMVYGAVQTTNAQIIKFEEDIGSDIGSFLDIPTLPDAFKGRAEEQLRVTLERAREARNAGFVVNAGVQGGRFLDLRARCAKSLGKDFSLIAVGGIVPLLESYRFTELVDVIATVKKSIPLNRPVHAFGLGHPMVFGLAVALGCDLFDSASYVLYAQQGRYMTVSGTERVDELEHISCTCPVCAKYGLDLKSLPDADKIREIARHNLYVCASELEEIKQRISEGSLWEHIAVRCRAHPHLYAGLKRLLKHNRWLAKLDPITKKSAFFETGEESHLRTEVVNVRERVKRVESANTVKLPCFGEVPVELLDIYPLGQSVFAGNDPRDSAPQARDLAKIKAQLDYQFGEGASAALPENIRIKRSRKTGRIRALCDGKNLYASVRASDHFILPKKAMAEKLLKILPSPRLRVILEDDKEVTSCVKEGKSVFAKFVEKTDPNLRCGDECLVVDKKDNLLRVGTLALAPAEIKDFNRGAAVKTR